MRALIVPAIVGLGSLPRALAWGAAGHEIVATIAQSHLDPQVLNTVCSILFSSDTGSSSSSSDRATGDAPPCYLATVATWADRVRYHARWSSPLHYVGAVGDYPPDRCLFPGTDGWHGRDRINVLDAIQNVSSILIDFAHESSSRAGVSATATATATGAPELAQEALKFLIHFAGDMHQPLHLTNRDRGGNGDKVHWDNRVTNLHSVWDSSLIAKAIRTTPRNYTRPIPLPAVESALRGAIYDSYVRRIVWEGLGSDQHGGRWGSEADSWLECPTTSGDPDSDSKLVYDEYEDWVLAPQEQQVMMAAAATRRLKRPTTKRPRKPSPPGHGGGPPQTSDSDSLCPYAWGKPVHALNCDIVWPPELDNPEEATAAAAAAGRVPRKEYLELDTPRYSGQIEKQWIIEKLLAQAGVRLAGILNGIFSPQQQQ
ncbi:phospholipase C/P1 nuclease domain-containing protein [Russula compacta]|nr:phospholipase C/P1 nuclease domain-containing protein [Russula compacta]